MLTDSWIIAKKEIRLLFKSTRRIGLLFMTGFIIILGGGIGGFIALTASVAIETPVEVTVIQDDNNGWGEYFYTLLRTSNSTKNYSFINKTESELDQLLESNNFSLLLYIPANFSEIINQSLPAQYFLYYDNSDTLSEVSVATIASIAAILNRDIVFLDYGGPININRIYSVPIGTSKGSGALVASILTMIPMYAIILLVLPPLTLVLISVTIEREQKTLESLLLQPLDRKNIITGKLLYGIILVTLNTIINIVSILTLILGLYFVSSQEIKDGLFQVLPTIIESLGFTAWLYIIYFLVGLILVSVLMVTAAVMFSLVAKDEREANMVISFLVVIPMFGVLFLVFLPVNALPELIQLLIVAIPLLGYLFGFYIAFLAGEITVVAWLSFVFQFLWIALAVWVAGKIIESEGILDISFKRLFSFRRK
ncbi:MAG: ABC transporter permease [Candidatus Hodarchaeales archaeon]|jgi:ABC-type Na+ efflux pump permease subunit